MTAHTWHASDEMVRRYVRGEAGIAAAASVEAHVVRCAACRERVGAAVAREPLDDAWARVAARIAEPPAAPAARLLGVSDADAVLLSASRSLNGAWTLATLVVVGFAAVAALPGTAAGRALYLLVAPLVPVLGVVAAFASADPLNELASATPYPKARLSLLRTAAVVVTGVPVAIAVGLAVPGIAWLAFAWLLPALALTLLALVAMTWWEPEPIGIAAGGAWMAVITTAYAGHDVAAAVGGGLQVAYLAIAALAAAALAFRMRAARTPGGYA